MTPEQLRYCAEQITKTVDKIEDGSYCRLKPDEFAFGLLEPYELAVNYLAEHPVDDDELITKEWLLSVGFSSLDSRYGPNCLQLGGLNVWKGNDQGDWQFRFELSCLNRHRSFETCGDVRRLCRALGIDTVASKVDG